MSMSEADYYAVFGLEQPSEEPAPEPDATDGEVADPAGTEPEDTQSEPENTEDVVDPPIDEGEDGAPAPMSRDERKKQAKERRQRQINEAVQEALTQEREKTGKAHKEELQAIFAGAGLIDRYHDNKPVTNMEEFRAWQEAQKAEQLSRELKEGRLTPESLQQAIESSPTVQGLREKPENKPEEKPDMAQIVRQELEEIKKLDPSIQSINDITELPTGAEFRRLINRGNISFLEAFKVANFDRIQTLRAAAQRQAAKNAESKSHMKGINASANGGTEVSDREMKIYKTMCPWMSDEEIRADFAKRMKG